MRLSLRLPFFAYLCVLAIPAVHAQSSEVVLREHIVHTLDENGHDVYKDDRITSAPDTTICFIYVGRKQNGPLWLRLQVRYADYKALNMTGIKFSKGDKAVEMTPSADLLHHDNNGIFQWEWYDAPPGENEMKVIRAIIAEPGVKLTLVGRDRTEERMLTELERMAMSNVLEQGRVLARSE